MDAGEGPGPRPEEPRAEPGAPPDADAAPSSDPRPRAVLVLMAVVLLLALIGIVVVAVSGNGPDARRAVEDAVARSVGAKTANVALSLSLHVAGTHESIAGNGTTDFRTNATTMTMTYSVARRSVVERAIVSGDTGYFNVGPIVGEVAPGKSWLSMDLGRAGPGGPNGVAGSVFSDPNAMVALLRTSGTTVRTLGSSTVDGVGVQRYAIRLSPAGIEKVMSSSQVPASVRAQLSHVHYDRMEYTVSVDGTGFLKEVQATAGFGGDGVPATVDSAMRFSDYGIPVHVVPPPSDEVITFDQFEKLLAQSRGHSTT